MKTDSHIKYYFQDYSKSLLILKELVQTKLMKRAVDEFGLDSPEEIFVLDEELLPEEKYFDNYYFTPDSIVFIYNPYEISAWSYGDHHIEIKFEELIKSFVNEIKLIDFLKTLTTQ